MEAQNGKDGKLKTRTDGRSISKDAYYKFWNVFR